MIAPLEFNVPPYLRALGHLPLFPLYGTPGWARTYGGFFPPGPGGFEPPPVPQFTMHLPPGPSTGWYAPGLFGGPGPFGGPGAFGGPFGQGPFGLTGLPLMRHQGLAGLSPLREYPPAYGPARWQADSIYPAGIRRNVRESGPQDYKNLAAVLR